MGVTPEGVPATGMQNTVQTRLHLLFVGADIDSTIDDALLLQELCRTLSDGVPQGTRQSLTCTCMVLAVEGSDLCLSIHSFPLFLLRMVQAAMMTPRCAQVCDWTTPRFCGKETGWGTIGGTTVLRQAPIWQARTIANVQNPSLTGACYTTDS